MEQIETTIIKKRKKSVFGIFPIPAFVVICIAVVALVIHITSYISTEFADFFNENISSVFRNIAATVTGIVPFSIGETIIICLPVTLIFMSIFYLKSVIDDEEKSKRFLAGIFSLLTIFYSLFVFNFGVGYRNSSLDKKLGLEKHNLTAQQLYDTFTAVNKDLASVIDSVEFQSRNESSLMPFTVDEMVEKINDAYDTVCDEYPFITRLHSRIKYVALSPLLTYTHISGIYSYYTGESNLNVNFPDYTLVYTTAHEFAHQRGIAREDEANFVAFLVCTESDNDYIRYCGYQSMVEYLLNALYKADPALYKEAAGELNIKSRAEIIAFNSFFTKYEDSVASKVSSTVNNTFLQAQGVSEGERSYGMVVDLCAVYYESMTK